MPPNSVEAEESVLGAVLMSADAANSALEKLHAEDFYRPAHQSIFQSISELFDGNQPIDAVTVSEALRRSGALDRVGGVGYLTQLIDSVPTASNIEYYADIVEEHALRRRLLRTGGDIAGLATTMDDPIGRYSTVPSKPCSPSPSGASVRAWPLSTRCWDPPSSEPRSSTGWAAKSPVSPPGSVISIASSPGSTPPTWS